jgi:hypothetical protein
MKYFCDETSACLPAAVLVSVLRDGDRSCSSAFHCRFGSGGKHCEAHSSAGSSYCTNDYTVNAARYALNAWKSVPLGRFSAATSFDRATPGSSAVVVVVVSASEREIQYQLFRSAMCGRFGRGCYPQKLQQLRVRRPADKLYVQTLSIGCAVRRIIRWVTLSVVCLIWAMLTWGSRTTVPG